MSALKSHKLSPAQIIMLSFQEVISLYNLFIFFNSIYIDISKSSYITL